MGCLHSSSSPPRCALRASPVLLLGVVFPRSNLLLLLRGSWAPCLSWSLLSSARPGGVGLERTASAFYFPGGLVKWAQRPCKMLTSRGCARLHPPACKHLPPLPACLLAPGLPRELPGPSLWGAAPGPSAPSQGGACASLRLDMQRMPLCPNPQPRIPRTDPQPASPGPPGRLLAHRAWRPPRRGIPLTPGRRPPWPRPRHNTMWARGLGRPGRALTPLM